jgi:hypothetical protein
MNGNEVKARAALDFLGWLSTYSPETYAGVLEQVPEAATAMSVPAHMEGLGQDPTTQAQPAEVPWWQKAIDIAGSVATQYLQFEAQKDVLKVQQDRASRGLPPITSDVYAPTIRHQVDIPPEFKQAAMGTGTLLALGGGALLLFMMMNR